MDTEDVDCDRLDGNPGVGPETPELPIPELPLTGMLLGVEVPSGGVATDDTVCEVEVGKRGGTIGRSTKVF